MEEVDGTIHACILLRYAEIVCSISFRKLRTDIMLPKILGIQ